MLPIKANTTSRAVKTFDVMTPEGRVWHFPQPGLMRRLLAALYSHGDVLAMSAIVLGLIYSSGFLAEAMGPLTAECRDNQGLG